MAPACAAAIGRRLATCLNGKAGSHNKQHAMTARGQPGYAVWPRRLAAALFIMAVALIRRFRALVAHWGMRTILWPAPPTTAELALRHGVGVESHVVRTSDGYMLEMHRLVIPNPKRCQLRTEDMTPSDSSDGEGDELQPRRQSPARPPVMMMHGAMLSSEIWVCHPRANLAISLARAGHDVWLANRRGNRYAQQHETLRPHTAAFWDFSIDHTIAEDVPAQMRRVLSATGSAKVSLVGFSQGTTELFAALAKFPKLRRRVSALAALAATATPGALSCGWLRILLGRAPHALYAIFGRRAMFSSVALWQRLLPPSILARLMRGAMAHLFAWRTARLLPGDCALLFQHMYSPTSVKQLVHWFQIMAARRLQPYASSGTCRPAPYDLAPVGSEVRTLALCGGADSLADAAGLAADLGVCPSAVRVVAGYEHMDLLWAPDAPQHVHAHVLSFLSSP